MRRQLIGLPRAQQDLIMRLKHKTSAIFLFNLESKELYGVFEAEGQPGLDLDPEAWQGSVGTSYYKGHRPSSRYPAQCRFTIAADFETPVAYRHFREIFRNSSQMIRSLSADEVKKLIKVFQARSKLRRVIQPPMVTPAAAVSAAAGPSFHNIVATPSTGVASAVPSASFTHATLSHASAPSSSSAGIAPTTTSTSTSRRNSIDSTTSREDDSGGGKKSKRSTTKIQQTCKRWLADECTHTDETCKYLHVPSICRAFQRGTCPKGSACPFIHDKQDREHYRHGRSYCQKTAVHTDIPPTQINATLGKNNSSTIGATSTATKSSAPKDSLDSILSGLGSWKIASKKSEVTPTPSLTPATVTNAATSNSQQELQHDNDQLDDELTRVNGNLLHHDDELGLSVPYRHDGDSFEDDAAEFEQDQAAAQSFDPTDDDHVSIHHSHPHVASVVNSFDTHAALGGQMFLDSSLAFDMPIGVNGVSQSGPNGWSNYDDAAFVPSEDPTGSMYFVPPGGNGFHSTSSAPSQSPSQSVPPLQPVEEFPWFMQFRANVVQPALQVMHAREQQTQQKIIGPD